MGFSDDASELAKTLALRYKVGIILGGLPSEADVMPSVIFIIMYASLFLVVFWRIKTHTLTFGQLWKPLLVVMLRIATYAMRIKLSEQQQQWINDVFVTELVFLRIGPIILSSAMICLFRDAVLPYLPTVAHPNIWLKLSLKHFVTLLNMATYFSLGLTIAIAFDVKQAIGGNGEARVKMHKSKMISIWMMVAIDACIYLLTIVPLVLLHQEKYVKHLVVNKAKEETKFMAILSVCTFLVVVSAFKAAQLTGHDLGSFSRYNIVVNQKILFYCVCCAGEFVACALLLSLAWARIVPPPELLEAYCRIHSQGGNDGNGRANGQDGLLNGTAWPNPPPRAAGAAGQMSECGMSEGTPTLGGMSGAQICHVVPRQATVQCVTIADQGNEEWTDIPFSARATPGNLVVSQAKLVSFAPTTTSRRTSTGSLSTISEHGEEKTVTPPLNRAAEQPKTAIAAARKRSESLESLALPPTLLPHAPPEVLQAQTAALGLHHRSRSLTAPQNSPKRSQTPQFNAPPPDNGNDISTTVTTPIKHDPKYGEQDVFLAAPAPAAAAGATLTVSHAPLHVVTVTDSPAAAIAPSSACSIRSHWSEDSDDDDHHRDSSGSGSYRPRFIRHKRDTKSGESMKELQWD